MLLGDVQSLHGETQKGILRKCKNPSSAKLITAYELHIFFWCAFPFNPFMPNVFSHPYQLNESISNFRVVGWYFSLKDTSVSKQWRTWSDAACCLWSVFHCLQMSQKRSLGLYGLITYYFIIVDIDECPSGCSNNGSCTNSPGDFSCNCTGTGYEGSTCADGESVFLTLLYTNGFFLMVW